VDSALANALLEWRKYQSPNTKPDARVDLVDLSSQQDILRREIKPAALRAGIWKIGWPLFHFSTLLFHLIAEHGSRHQGATRVAETLDCTKHDERLHEAISEQKRIANSAVVGLLFGKGTFVFSNGNQQALSAARLAFIESLSSDCYCGA